MKTLTQAEKLIRRPEGIVNDEAKLLEAFATGDVSHQGDLMIVGIAKLPKGAKPRANRQVAEGNTQGSRHVLELGQLYDCKPEIRKRSRRRLVWKSRRSTWVRCLSGWLIPISSRTRNTATRVSRMARLLVEKVEG